MHVTSSNPEMGASLELTHLQRVKMTLDFSVLTELSDEHFQEPMKEPPSVEAPSSTGRNQKPHIYNRQANHRPAFFSQSMIMI